GEFSELPQRPCRLLLDPWLTCTENLDQGRDGTLAHHWAWADLHERHKRRCANLVRSLFIREQIDELVPGWLGSFSDVTEASGRRSLNSRRLILEALHQGLYGRLANVG